MTRVMFDAVTPANLPAGADLYAAYIDGRYANVAAVRARFPGARVVTITVTGAGQADVVDVEKGDVTPDHAPAWVVRMRALGRIPTVYCPRALWSLCVRAFADAHVAPPQWWIAQYDNDPTLPPGAVAKQYGGNAKGGYDVSSVADFWPGIDQEVKPMFQPAIILRPVVADCACPTGGAWLLGDDGGVYNFAGAPFHGAPASKPYFAGRKPARIRVSEVPGKVYDVVDTAGEVYSYPV